MEMKRRTATSTPSFKLSEHGCVCPSELYVNQIWYKDFQKVDDKGIGVGRGMLSSGTLGG